VNPDALAFATKAGTAFDRHNLVNHQFKPTCKRLGLVGGTWHWLRPANARSVRNNLCAARRLCTAVGGGVSEDA
jgi:hypothetical protein